MRLKIVFVGLALIAAACGGDDSGDSSDTTGAPAATAAPTTEAPTAEAPTTEAPTSEAPPAEAESGVTVALAESSLGEIVVDGDGNALYLFVPDAQGVSTCYDGCAEAWPPMVGEGTAGAGVDGGLLGSVARDDGSTQVTLNGWPLYYFAGDTSDGDTNGQGVNDVWFVLNANGDQVGDAGAEAAGSGAVVALAESSLGEILVDGEGITLYLFAPDAQGESTCYDGCASAWPPAVGAFAAGEGIDGELLGSVARTDGTEQATYNGWPLYYFASDAAPGDTNGQGANDVWYVLSVNGDAVSS